MDRNQTIIKGDRTFSTGADGEFTIPKETTSIQFYNYGDDAVDITFGSNAMRVAPGERLTMDVPYPLYMGDQTVDVAFQGSGSNAMDILYVWRCP